MPHFCKARLTEGRTDGLCFRPGDEVDGKSKMGLKPFNSDIGNLIEVEEAMPNGGIYRNHCLALEQSGQRPPS